MRAVCLLAVVTVSTIAGAHEPIAAVDLTKRLTVTPAPLESDSSLRMQDAVHRAENTLWSVVERVQHFGVYRTMWATPFSGNAVSGPVYGVSLRFDLP
jgi:hypothetical protein